jgi:hypothetical protein
MMVKQGLLLNAPDLEAEKILGDSPKIILETKTLDPKGLTYVGTVLAGTARTISIRGQWSPGRTRPYWGPGGDPSTIFQGAPKWSAVTLVLTEDYQIVGGGYGPGPFKITNMSDSMGWIVCVKMNDSYYQDNYNHPADPMTAEWSL